MSESVVLVYNIVIQKVCRNIDTSPTWWSFPQLPPHLMVQGPCQVQINDLVSKGGISAGSMDVSHDHRQHRSSLHALICHMGSG
jgi:hypothetical protein